MIPDSFAVSSNPMLNLIKQQVIINRNETQIEKLNLMPDFSVGYFNQSNKDISTTSRFTGVELSISIPIFCFSQISKIKASKINEQIAQNNYEYYQKLVQSEFQILMQEYQKYKTSLDYYEKLAIPQANLIIEQSGKSWMTGDIDYVEYVMNLDKALDIKLKYLLTLNNYNQSVIAIDKILGKTN